MTTPTESPDDQPDVPDNAAEVITRPGTAGQPDPDGPPISSGGNSAESMGGDE